MITQARKMKPTAKKIGGGKTMKVFYNDHLTPENQRILMTAKAIGKEIKVWSRNGEVLYQGREPGCRVFKLETIDDVSTIKDMYQEDAGNERTRQKRGASEISPILEDLHNARNTNKYMENKKNLQFPSRSQQVNRENEDSLSKADTNNSRTKIFRAPIQKAATEGLNHSISPHFFQCSPLIKQTKAQVSKQNLQKMSGIKLNLFTFNTHSLAGQDRLYEF